ncbi:IS110 family transposase [Heliobacillus mobilis]|uniref:IS110 family transposase n=1 Tax=Heliobacterium mobile TaxID=28064 RepID=A0A6I3SQT7_HELMO|nr:IS110 family transposase [Heliobacterium mobile]MTV51076.1 IS110 family transposase [Heliobacterium mobile]
MNYTQKSRIEQITDSTLIIGIDVAKATHVARAQDHRGIELGKRLIFDSNHRGFEALNTWIKELQRSYYKTTAVVGMEPTGHYWLTMAHYLLQKEIKAVVVNPAHVKKSKELDDNSPTKNDIKDARVIAQLVKDGRYSEPNILTGKYAELRVAMVQRERLMRSLIEIKNQVHNWLDRYFPEYPTVFKDWEGKASMIALKNFPLPQDVVNLGMEGIVTQWKSEVKRAVGIKRAIKLIETASTSVGISLGQTMARREIEMLLEQYFLLTKQLDELAQDVVTILEEIPGAVQMLAIPGLGWITVAGFLAETGDLQAYSHPQQILKLAGLNLKENSSGKHKGQTRITKRGRPRIRALLFRSMLVLVSKNQQFKQLHQYYINRKDNPLRKKQSIIALCGKLIRVLFAIGKKSVDYDPHKLLGKERLMQFQLVV